MGIYDRGSLVLVNGRLFTSDPARPRATVLGIQNGLISYVGDDADEARAAVGTSAPVIDLEGRTATAGLIDAHMHPYMYAEQLLGIDLTKAKSSDDILDVVRERVATVPTSEPISGWGYYPPYLEGERVPSLAELDAVAPNHAVVLRHRSGHEMLVNSETLRRVGYDRSSADPVGGYLEHDADGELTGRLVENAMDPVHGLRPPLSPERYDTLLRAVSDKLLSYGTTSSTEANLTDSGQFAGYQRLAMNGENPRVRFNLMLDHWKMLDPLSTVGIGTGFGDRWLRCGAIKFFIDGTEGMSTAKISEPFKDDPTNTGMWMFPPEEYRERVLRAHNAGWQCATHAIGDAAIELVLDVYRDAQKQNPRPDLRHRIEHASLLRPDLVERFAHEGVVPVPGARFASNDYQVLIERLGPERVRWYQPWNSLLERNVPVAVSSDAPVQTADPARNLKAIVTSRAEHNRDLTMQPEERIGLDEALMAYTVNGAWASNEEHLKGALRIGLLGDVAVFNTDLFALDPLDLDTVSVDLTIVDGVVAYRR